MITAYHQSILIVDDHRLFAEGIRSLLISCGYVTVDVFTAGIDLLNKIITYNPALLLLDISMDDIDGIALSALIRADHPAIKILIISMHARRIYIEKALQAGVDGYLIKNASDEELKLAVATILAGERFYSSQIKDVLVSSLLPSPDSNKISFTKREKDILLLMSEGFSSKEIADRLFVSVNTVETHRKNMFFKTGLRNMAHLIKWAFENGQI